jgi:hypothetical protein
MRPASTTPESADRSAPQERSVPPSAAAGEAAATGVAQPPTGDRPRPLAPLNGAYVDASAAPFEWRGVSGATGYQLQVAPTPAFDRDVVEVESGPTTSLTLYGTLPVRDDDMYWRVRADAPEATWSGYGRFVPTHDDAVEAYRSEQDAARAERSKEAARQREAREADLDLIPHYARDESVTSAGEAATLLLMLLSFALTIWLLFALT